MTTPVRAAPSEKASGGGFGCCCQVSNQQWVMATRLYHPVSTKIKAVRIRTGETNAEAL